ncbi:MAG: VanZ family protein [Methylophilus sp.]|nr:VanZ family protein [Methylophilus sp.]
MKQRYQRILCAMPYVFGVLVAVVTLLMLVELPPKQGGWPYWDKVQHMGVFLIMTKIGFYAYPSKKWWVAIHLAVFGALVEVLQGLLTVTRQASVYDWLADVAGILLMVVISEVFLRKDK